MAPTGPPAAAPTANPVTTPIFSCLDAGCRTVTVSSACTGIAVTQAAATARAIERLRIWAGAPQVIVFIKGSSLLSWLSLRVPGETLRFGLHTVQLTGQWPP